MKKRGEEKGGEGRRGEEERGWGEEVEEEGEEEIIINGNVCKLTLTSRTLT